MALPDPRNPMVSRIIHRDTTERPLRDGLESMSPPSELSPIPPPDNQWVETTMASMGTPQKVGQLILAADHSRGESLISQFHVGGFIFLGNDQHAGDVAWATSRLNAHSPLPLFHMLDAETGAGARVAEATTFPLAMALGAAADPALARLMGRITAIECRALGINVISAPVLDLATDPDNPIIATRAFADSSTIVEILTTAFAEGVRSQGVACCGKHFPGHGHATGDSHHSLPHVDIDAPTFHETHLRPFATLGARGLLDMMMTAHVWYPSLDPGPERPATLSHPILSNLLRDSLGYEGLVAADAFNMEGLRRISEDEGELALMGFLAGLDLLTAPADVEGVVARLTHAVEDGTITLERLDASVRRILKAKSQLRGTALRIDQGRHWESVLGHPSHREAVLKIAERAFTRATQRSEMRPFLRQDDSVALLKLGGSQLIFHRFSMEKFQTTLTSEIRNLRIIEIPKDTTLGDCDEILDEIQSADRIIVASNDWTHLQNPAQARFLRDLCTRTSRPPVAFVSFGSPALARNAAGAELILCGYASIPEVQQTAAQVLLGHAEATGQIPVSWKDFS